MQFESPEVLVLGAGGILGEAWMGGLLAGLQEGTGFDPRDCDHFIGTSAGSIVAAGLAGGVDPASRPEPLAEPPPGTPSQGSRGRQPSRMPRARCLAARSASAAAPVQPRSLRWLRSRSARPR